MDNIDYNSLTDEKKKEIRIKLAEDSIENFIKIYVPHHFSFDLDGIEKINSEIEEKKQEKIIELKENKNIDYLELNKVIKEYDTAKVDLKYADKVVFNKTSYPTFDIFKKILNNQNILYAFVKARGFGKTTELLILILMSCAFKKHKFIIFIAENLDKAEETLKSLMEELENNILLVEDFPHLKPKMSKLTNKIIAFSSRRIVLDSGTKIMAVGAVKTSIRGRKWGRHRPDLILPDDINNDEHVESYIQRKKTDNWFRKQVMSLGGGTGCSICMTGTIIHYDDIMANAVLNKKYKGFKTLLFPAIDEDNNSNWDLIFPKIRLDYKKEEMGIGAFSSEYLCNPLPDDEAIFKEDDAIRTEFDPEIIDNIEDRIGFIDMCEAGKGDYTAFIISGIRNRHVYVLDAFIKKININNIMPIILEYIKKWNIHTLGIESNNMKYFIEELKKYLYSNGVYISIIGIHHVQNKNQRIATLISPIWQSGLLHFRTDRNNIYPLLMEQLYGFPIWKNDDAPDALAGVIEITKKCIMEYIDIVKV